MTAYDVRRVLNHFNWNASAAIGGLTTMGGMNRKDAEESVVASGGEIPESYIEYMRARKKDPNRQPAEESGYSYT